MLRPIKDVRRPHDGPRRDQVNILGAVPCSVDLSIVVDLLHNLDPRSITSVRSHLTLVIIVLRLREGHVSVGQLDLGDLQVVLVLLGRVRANEETVRRVGLVA